MNKKIVSFVLLLIGTALLITAVRFLVFEPNAFKGNGDILNTFFKTMQGIIGLVVDIYGLIPFFKKELPALSVIPDTAKLSLDLPLIGREHDLEWLQIGHGDRVLTGQPGSGKTFLLYKFAKQREGLFVNDFNLGKVISEYKRKKPKTLIVDDAQLNTEFIRGLINYRKRKSANFDILASCWPSHEADVLDALNVPASSAHYLNLLTLEQLVEVVEAMAVGWKISDGLTQEIVEQSIGRPGLAVVLTDLCLKEGGIQDIVLGDALARWVTTKLLPASHSQNISAILAVISMGGNMGMSMITVAKRLELNLLEVQTVISNLVGGLIFDNTPNLVVYPPALRHSLVRDIFFRGALSLPIVEVIKDAPSLHEVAKTLIGARGRGANIPQELLLDILGQVDSGDLWQDFSYLGEREVTWVLENKPELLTVLGHPALLSVPNKVIPLLLSTATDDERELHSSPDHPIRIIQDWVFSAYPGNGQAIQRRKILLDSIISWLKSTKIPYPGIRALPIVITPEFSNTYTNPGSGNSITWQSGHLSALEVDALKKLWPDILAIIASTTIEDWMPIRQIIETWAYPGRIGNVLPDVYEEMKSFASQMIVDLLPSISRHAGLLHWASHVARMANLSVTVPVNSTFEILYPDVDISDFHIDSAKQRELVVELAQLWHSRNPDDVMNELRQIENETQLAGHVWPRLTPLLCLELSNRVTKQDAWIEAGIKVGLAGDLIMPFMTKVIEIRGRGWITKVRRWLQQPSLKPYVVQLVLTSAKMPQELLAATYSNLDNLNGLIEVLCLRGEIPEDRVLKLLKHTNSDVALAAAKGEWMLNPTKNIRKSLEMQWELVITNLLQEDYLLGEIFAERPGLAASWLSARINEASSKKDRIAGYRLERAFGMAANSLSVEDRRSLLKTLSPFSHDYLIVAPLVGDDIDLYEELLANKTLKHLHLNPLYGKPTHAWVLRVMAALSAGYSAKEIAHATRWGDMKVTSWSGKESDMWDEWMKNFEPYLLHAEEGIREVSRICVENAKYSRDRALQEELKEAVFGRR